MAVKKKNEDTSYQDFKRELAGGNLGSLYVFHGEETYLRDYYLGKMKDALLTGGLDDFNYHTLNGKDLTLQKLRELVDAMPMMSERTFLVVSDYDIYRGEKEELLELLRGGDGGAVALQDHIPFGQSALLRRALPLRKIHHQDAPGEHLDAHGVAHGDQLLRRLHRPGREAQSPHGQEHGETQRRPGPPSARKTVFMQ